MPGPEVVGPSGRVIYMIGIEWLYTLAACEEAAGRELWLGDNGRMIGGEGSMAEPPEAREVEWPEL